MFRKVIKYTDYDGNQQEETCYFNLTKAEIAKLDITSPGGLQAYLQKIIDAKDNQALIETFEKIIKMSYCERIEGDSKHIRKNPALSEAFMSTEAYSELFLELITDADKAAEFINGITPEVDGKQEAMQKAIADSKAKIEAAKATEEAAN